MKVMNRMRTSVVALAACAAWACSEPVTSPIKTLQKIDVVTGTGAEAVSGKSISVHYTGWLYDENTADNHGRKIDSSRDRGAPLPFVLGTGAVIDGWDQGIAGMKVGGKRTLIIPPELAYGRSGNGPVPANAALIFDVELLSVQ